MARPHNEKYPDTVPIFPEEVWDGTTNNPDRVTLNTQSDPDYNDYLRLSEEVRALQRSSANGPLTVAISGSLALSSAVKETILIVDASSGEINITLPAPSEKSAPITVKKVDVSEYAVNILPNDSETIDGDSSLIVDSQWSAAKLTTDGTNWYII